MHILAVNDDASGGGAAHLYQRTNAILRKGGHTVIELTGESLEAGANPTRARWGVIRGIRHNIRHVYAPRLLRVIDQLLAAHRVDVAHVHNLHGRLTTQIMPFLKRRGVPVVYQVNDYYFFCNSYYAYNRRLDAPCRRCVGGQALWALRYGCVSYLGEPRYDKALLEWLRRLALQLARPWAAVDLFLVTSDQAGAILEEWGVPRTRQEKLLNPMCLDEFQDQEAPVLGDEIVFYGSCLPNKGAWTFLEALDDVEPETRLGVYLMGMTPDYEARLRHIAARRHLRLRVDGTVRWSNGLRPILASARAIVVPSQWWVTSENIVYEGLLMGKPVILGRIGGNMELVEHGETGFCFEPGNAKELAGYINCLAREPQLALRMGTEAWRRSRERFAETVFLKRLEAAYERVRGRAELDA